MDSIIEVGTTILGTIVLITGAIGGTYSLYQKLRNSIFAPKILLKLNDVGDYITRKDNKTGQAYKWIPLKFYNTSKRELKNCTFVIKKILEQKDNNEWILYNDFDSKLHLISNSIFNKVNLTLTSQEMIILDLCKFTGNDLIFDHLITNGRLILSCDRKYKIVLESNGDNAKNNIYEILIDDYDIRKNPIFKIVT